MGKGEPEVGEGGIVGLYPKNKLKMVILSITKSDDGKVPKRGVYRRRIEKFSKLMPN